MADGGSASRVSRLQDAKFEEQAADAQRVYAHLGLSGML